MMSMASAAAIAKPILWITLEYLKQNVIDVGSATLGSTCYDPKTCKQYTDSLLRWHKRPQRGAANNNNNNCNNSDFEEWITSAPFPKDLIVKLPLICSINKILIRSDSHVPQEMLVQYSVSDTEEDSFKTLTTVTSKKMRKGHVYVIKQQIPFDARYLRLRVLKGAAAPENNNNNNNSNSSNEGGATSDDQQHQQALASISHVSAFGAPSFTPENLKHLDVKTVMTLAEAARGMISRKSKSKKQSSSSASSGTSRSRSSSSNNQHAVVQKLANFLMMAQSKL